MKPDPKIRATPRPVRVAYLLEDGVDTHGWLDAIFAACFGRHGGRQSLIVPVVNGVITERYREWLRVLDPDFVLALTYDNQGLVPGLVDLLADTDIVACERKRDETEKYPRFGFDATGLTSLSWLPFLKVVSGIQRVAPEFILDRYPAWVDDGFITDNFGTLYDSAQSFPIHEQLGVRGLILTPKDAPENRWRFGGVAADEVQDAYDVVDRMSKASGIVTLGQLSNLNSQPHRYEHPWTNGFCVVVGDSFADRISCWNAGLLFGDAQSQTFKTMRVPAAIRSDEIRTSQIANFLRQRNWIGGNNGPSRIVVRSHSLAAAEVQEFVERLRKVAMSHVDFAAIGSIDDCCPSDTKLIHGEYRFGSPSPATADATVRDVTTIVAVPEPFQLSYCAGMHPIFSQGCWFLDLVIDRLNDNGRFSNVREAWTLPIRPQLVRLFVDRVPARISKSGSISVQVDTTKHVVEVKQPTDSDVFWHILNDRQHYALSDMRAKAVKPVAYKYSEPSDKGRYLQGLLGMFGTLSDVEAILNNHFWRSQFSNMAAPAQDQQEEVIKDLQLRMKAKNGFLQIDDATGWQTLAERVIQKSIRLRVPRETTRYSKLFVAWEKELTAAIDANDQLKRRRDAILAEAPEDLNRSLSFLLERGIFYRGHEWVCIDCSHRNWVGVDSLKDIVSCDVCRRDHQLPVNVALDFRLNEFFATCLREHDTLTVAWALSALRHESSDCFMFAPQTALYRDYPENQGKRVDRELDVVCIVDGKFVIGEVKAAVGLIARSDIEDLATTAQELNADVAILMALTGDQGMMDEKVQQLGALLPATITARGLVSDWDDTPSPYL
ncbi:MAG: hypothetical protein IH605_10695 [Burkholderiales bacterium]|nr:hypothetical protein [Burkholderiales bacterium]